VHPRPASGTISDDLLIIAAGVGAYTVIVLRETAHPGKLVLLLAVLSAGYWFGVWLQKR
jgi:hypothetical protein